MRKMQFISLIVLVAFLASNPSQAASRSTVLMVAKATAAPTAAPAASAGETKFTDAATKDLQARFPTTAAATAGGYFRYTDEDQTGAISWVNTHYWKGDPQHPSQLWFDVNGRLIGADFSVLQSTYPKAPKIWGISASRWLDFSPAHIHFGVNTPSGVQYGASGNKTWTKIGASMTDPTAADVVKLGQTDRWKILKIPAPKSASDVAFVFEFPAIWDLQVWLVPNPLGAFAEHNPNVKPSANAKYQD